MNADSITAMQIAMVRHPDLTIDGLGGGRQPEFEERRACLLSKYGIEQFELCREWFALVPRRKAPNDDADSYRIKHVIEKWAGTYIENGACLAAAISLDIPLRKCPSGINAQFAIAGPRHWPVARCAKLKGDRVKQ